MGSIPITGSSKRSRLKNLDLFLFMPIQTETKYFGHRNSQTNHIVYNPFGKGSTSWHYALGNIRARCQFGCILYRGRCPRLLYGGLSGLRINCFPLLWRSRRRSVGCDVPMMANGMVCLQITHPDPPYEQEGRNSSMVEGLCQQINHLLQSVW